MGSVSSLGHSAEPLIGGRDRETDLLEEVQYICRSRADILLNTVCGRNYLNCIEKVTQNTLREFILIKGKYVLK